jgi:hypothetical protein
MKLTNVSVFILATLLSCTALGMAAAPARQSFCLQSALVSTARRWASPRVNARPVDRPRIRRALATNIRRLSLTRDRARVIVAAMSLRAMRMMFSMGCMHKHAAGSS